MGILYRRNPRTSSMKLSSSNSVKGISVRFSARRLGAILFMLLANVMIQLTSAVSNPSQLVLFGIRLRNANTHAIVTALLNDVNIYRRSHPEEKRSFQNIVRRIKVLITLLRLA